MNYSLRTLMLVAAGFCVVLASMAYPTAIVGDLFYTVGLLMIAYAMIAAIYLRGKRRAYWVGFLILFAGYFCHTVWPGEIRSAITFFQRAGASGTGFAGQGLITSRLLANTFEGIHPTTVPTRMTTRGLRGPFPPPDDAAARFIAFMTTGHTAIALLLGFGGGFVAEKIAAQTPATIKRPIEKILGEFDIQ